VVVAISLASCVFLVVTRIFHVSIQVELGIDRSMLRDAMTVEDAYAHASCARILEYVVSALVQSEDKARFVRDIMTMEDCVQVDIMAVIERVMSTTASLATAQQAPLQSDESEVSRDQSQSHTGDGHQRIPTRIR
jgi:hypothetical protein